MGTYQTKKCPYCRRAYERNFYNGIPSKENRIKYGSPIKVCPKCKHIFTDAEYREIAIDGVREVEYARVSPGTIVITAIVLIGGVLAVTSGLRAGWFMVGMSVLVFCEEYFGYEKRQKRLQKEIDESRERLSNPQYALLLQKLGYNVPDKYLSKEQEKEN